eukprot:COSAG06_NODE_1355_length_9743_cov_3.335061_9_plen_70_part_00
MTASVALLLHARSPGTDGGSARGCARRISVQIAKKGHKMTNRIEVTKDQALEVRTIAVLLHAAAAVSPT